jgi:ABC-2 type transport system permease protein/oleandomycin transport system permease protein
VSGAAVASRDDRSLAWALRDIVAMTGRNLTGMRRVPQVLVFSFVQPLVFVLIFRYVFGGSIRVPGVDYVDYLMPGIFVQTVTFGAITTAVSLADDKSTGLIERLRSLPMSRSAVLGGRVLADSVRNAAIVVMMLLVGLAVGFRTHTNVAMVLLGVVVMIVFGFAMAWVFALLGLSVANGEAAQAASFPLMAPLVFASNLFVDPSTMPGWMQPWAEHQPVSMTADAVRACMLGGPTAGRVLGALAWAAGIAVVLGPIAVNRYRRT